MSEEKTMNYYDGISKGYKELYHNEQELKIKNIIDFLPKKGKILDLGSGDGVLNKYLNKDVDLISFDLSQELLNLNNNKNKVQGSVENLPFNDKEFDYIISLTMVQDVQNIKKAISEINRVINSDSTLIISFLKMSSKREEIVREIEKYFNIEEEIEEIKDLILICKNG